MAHGDLEQGCNLDKESVVLLQYYGYLFGVSVCMHVCVCVQRHVSDHHQYM